MTTELQISHELLDYTLQTQKRAVSTVVMLDCGYKPGIYFGMPDEEYHAIKALSASGMKNLMISTMEFWSQSWMNPNYTGKSTPAMALGTGYGARIVEGKDAFYSRYVQAFDKSEYPEALDTNDDLKAALKALGQPVSGTKAVLIERLLEAEPNAQILENLKHDYAVKHAGKRFLSAAEIAEIEIAAFMMDRDPEASKCFQGGMPEVTVIWIDPKTKVPMKARFDYLKIKAIIDLKSFSNPQGKSLYNAIAATMASRKYHIQAANYLEADSFAVEFARQGQVFGDVDQKWLKAYADEQQERSFIFVFQQTGIAPVTRVRQFSRVLETYKIGVAAVREAQAKFAECWQVFGTDPWIDIKPMEQFGDEEFPLYMLEI